jgi:hypothetical protein
MSIKVWGNINLGLLLGLLQFVSTFGITAWYVRHANKKLDPAAEAIRSEIEHHDFDHGASAGTASASADSDGSAR